jgi:hypothetical protein
MTQHSIDADFTADMNFLQDYQINEENDDADTPSLKTPSLDR